MFENETATARSALRSGWSVRLIGDRGSGRSAVAVEIADALEQTGTPVLRCTGERVASNQAGYGIGRLASELGVPARMRDLDRGLDVWIDEICRRIEPDTVLVVDDHHRMDGVTVQALATVRERLGLRALITEVTGTDPADRFPLRWPERVIKLRPLDLVSTSALAREVLGERLAPSAVTRVFSKAGGLPALVAAMLQSGRERGLLELRAGSWVQVGYTLWNDDLAPLVDDLLSDLDEDVATLLEYLATEGPITHAALAERFGGATVARAEAGGLLRESSSTGRDEVIAWPPILADRFRRHRPQPFFSAGAEEGVPVVSGDVDAMSALARQFVDRSVIEARAAYERWTGEQSAANALSYYAAASGDVRQQDQLRRVLTTTVSREGAEPDDFLFVAARAKWLAFHDHEHAAAAEMLEQYGQRYPEWEPSASAVRTLMSVIGGAGLPEDLGDLLEPLPDPTGIREAVAMQVLLAAGRVAEARAYSDAIGPSERRSLVWARQLLLLLEGDPQGALRLASDEMRSSVQTLDRTSFASAAYSSAMSWHYLGDYGAVQRCVDAAVLVGRPVLEYTPLYTACLNIQGLIAVFTGQPSAKDSFLGESMLLMPQPGAFLGMGADSFQSIIDLPVTSEAYDRAAAAVVRRRTELGYVTGAVQTAFASLVIGYGPRVAAAFREAMDLRPIPAFQSAAGLVGLLESSASAAEIESFIRATGPGVHDSQLRAILRATVAYSRARGDESRAECLDRLLHLAFDNVFVPSPDEFDPSAQPTATYLTPREREIALLSGSLTNREISERLGVSVRTVDNHLAHALRKTSMRTRAELFALVESGR